MSIETEIQTEVDALRARFDDTKTLYREVCALLFFRYGITPTANKLYQFVRKGSMSAPADALSRFWDELRSKARIEIDQPDLPDEVKESAAAAIAGIWRQASAAARDELAAVREQASAEADVAKAELATAQQLKATLQQSVEDIRAQLQSTAEAAERVRTELEAERRAHAASAGRIQELQRTIEDMRAQSQRQQQSFSADLAKAGEAVESANQRADAAERRSMLEIDQERQAKARAEKQVESLRGQVSSLEGKAREAAQEHAEATSRLQSQLKAAQDGHETAKRAAEGLSGRNEGLIERLAAADRQLLQAQTEAQTLRGLVDRLSPAPAPAPGAAATAVRQRKGSKP